MFKVISPFLMEEIKDRVVVGNNRTQKWIVLENTGTNTPERFVFFGFTKDQTGIKMGKFYVNKNKEKKIIPIIAYVRVNKSCKMNDDSLVYLKTFKLLAKKGNFSLTLCQVYSTYCTDYCQAIPSEFRQQQMVKGC